MKVRAWEFPDYTYLASVNEPYNIIAFKRVPVFHPTPLTLENGETMYPGDTIAYLGGSKSSAGFIVLYPVMPVLFLYEGVYRTDAGLELAIWVPVDESRSPLPLEPIEEFLKITYGLAVLRRPGGVCFAHTTHAFAGRIIETTTWYKTHDEVPSSLISWLSSGSSSKKQECTREQIQETA